MTCDQARDALLVADLSDISAAEGDLAAHLEACPACRERARFIVMQTAILDAAVRRRARGRSRRMLVIASLPIAAGLIAIATVRSSAPEPALRARRTSPLPVARQVSLTVERGQTATVFKTADPSVTVIWLSPGVGQ
jgi:hypothetical protein